MRIVSEKKGPRTSRERVEVDGTGTDAYFSDRIIDGKRVLLIQGDALSATGEHRDWAVELSDREARKLFQHLSHSLIKAWEWANQK